MKIVYYKERGEKILVGNTREVHTISTLMCHFSSHVRLPPKEKRDVFGVRDHRTSSRLDIPFYNCFIHPDDRPEIGDAVKFYIPELKKYSRGIINQIMVNEGICENVKYDLMVVDSNTEETHHVEWGYWRLV